MTRLLRPVLKRLAFTLHRAGLRLGVHILPAHIYTPLPNILELARTRDRWAHRSELPGLAVDLEEQCKLLEEICIPFAGEYRGNKTYWEAMEHSFGPGYGYIEAQALHGIVRSFNPHHIVEVGSGVSTACLLAAAARNREEKGAGAKITCVEPYPSARLQALDGVELIAKPVQAVPLSLFEGLEENDLLFIDSTHTVIPGGDVNFLILEVLPRLQPGVIVHFHDIFFPYDYQPRVLQTFFHWTETSLLRAYLAGNERIKILFSLSHLHDERPEVLAKVFPEYDPEPTINGLSGDYRPMEYYSKHLPVSIFLQTR